MKAMNRKDIEEWLENHGITKCIIHPDLSVDVDGDVDISGKKLKALPFQFGKVSGNFYCHRNQLTSLRYCPTTVGGKFYCSNNKLESLQHCPTSVGGNFNCSNNQLTSLRDYPETVGGNFNCSNNQLTSLRYCPTTVGGNFNYSNNPLVVTPENEGSWIRAIKVHRDVYPTVKDLATPRMTAVYELRWEP